jgi:hypothetical protein
MMTQAYAAIFLIPTNGSTGTNGKRQEVDELHEEINSTAPVSPAEKKSPAEER